MHFISERVPVHWEKNNWFALKLVADLKGIYVFLPIPKEVLSFKSDNCAKSVVQKCLKMMNVFRVFPLLV